MKQRKIWMCVLVGAMVCGIASGQMKDQQKEIEDEIGIVLPQEKPNVTDEQKTKSLTLGLGREKRSE